MKNIYIGLVLVSVFLGTLVLLYGFNVAMVVATTTSSSSSSQSPEVCGDEVAEELQDCIDGITAEWGSLQYSLDYTDCSYVAYAAAARCWGQWYDACIYDCILSCGILTKIECDWNAETQEEYEACDAQYEQDEDDCESACDID